MSDTQTARSQFAPGDFVTVTYWSGDSNPKPGERLTVEQVRDDKVSVLRKGSPIVRWYPASSLSEYAPMSRKTFDTREFYSSHLCEPGGRGSWAFISYADYIATNRARCADYLDRVVWRKGTYTEAKRALPAGDWIVLP